MEAAVPNIILKMPGDSFAPLILTIGMSAFFAGLLVHLWWLAGAGAVVMLIALLTWLWPERELAERAGAAND